MEDIKNIGELEALTLDELDQVSGGYKPLKPKEGFIVYHIKKGDYLNKIARMYDCTVADMMRWNPKIKNKNLIYAGDYLYIKDPEWDENL